MTNVQIEDVLSSIRRLVAEGDKSKTAAKPVDQAPEENPAGRLVLTEALRVSNDDAAPAPVESQSDEETSDATRAAFEAAVTAEPDDWVADDAAPSGAFVLRNVIEDAVEIVFDDSELSEEPEATDEAPTFRHFDRDALTREDIPLKAMEMPEPAEEDADTAFEDELIADTQKDPEIDEKLNAFLSDEAMLADAGLDETILRQMIVDTIREELQSALGERITRNVRKLVRREIHRVIAAQDVD
jgi:hypothetical protein